MHYRDAVSGAQRLIAVGNGLHVPQSAEVKIAERAGDERRPGFDQRDLDRRIGETQILGHGGATEAATDHHHARALAGLRARQASKTEGTGGRAGRGELEEIASVEPAHGAPPALFFSPAM